MLPFEIDLLTDTHVHTRLCNHAVGEMEEYVQQGIARGLKKLIFLEHLEAGIENRRRTWLDAEAFAFYFQEGQRLQQAYADRIIIGLGVEAGYNRRARDLLQEGLACFSWDRIGLSCHFYYHQGHYLNLLSRSSENFEMFAEIGVERIVSEYFDSLLEGVETLACTALCHLDAVLRHFPGLYFTAAHYRQIEVLLDAMQERSVALELNTSGFVYRDQPFPAPWIVAAALQRGVSLSAGSDSHHPQEVGRFFADLPDYVGRALQAGPHPPLGSASSAS